MAFLEQIIEGFTTLHPLFGQIARTRTYHNGPVRNVRSPTTLDQTLPILNGIGSISTDDLRETNIESHTVLIHSISQSLMQSFSKAFFQGMDELTKVTGQVFDAGGKPFSFDHYLNVIENMPLSFDDQGKPFLPTMVIPPAVIEKLKAQSPTEEQTERFRNILKRKKEEFDAQNRSRRLSR